MAWTTFCPRRNRNCGIQKKTCGTADGRLLWDWEFRSKPTPHIAGPPSEQNILKCRNSTSMGLSHRGQPKKDWLTETISLETNQYPALNQLTHPYGLSLVLTATHRGGIGPFAEIRRGTLATLLDHLGVGYFGLEVNILRVLNQSWGVVFSLG